MKDWIEILCCFRGSKWNLQFERSNWDVSLRGPHWDFFNLKDQNEINPLKIDRKRSVYWLGIHCRRNDTASAGGFEATLWNLFHAFPYSPLRLPSLQRSILINFSCKTIVPFFHLSPILINILVSLRAFVFADFFWFTNVNFVFISVISLSYFKTCTCFFNRLIG